MHTFGYVQHGLFSTMQGIKFRQNNMHENVLLTEGTEAGLDICVHTEC